jgi:hypothetical protein
MNEYSDEFLESIAKTCHEVNRAYCEGIGDDSQVPWEEVSEEIKDNVIDGVLFILRTPNSNSSQLHDNWLDHKIKHGWVYGKENSEELKTHPCLLKYKDLPIKERTKDKLFSLIVKSM